MFKNNDALRAAGETVEYTPEILEEYARCKADILYWATKYFFIKTIDNSSVLVPLRQYQKKVLKAFFYPETHGKRHFILRSGRQSGKTTVISILLLHHTIFEENKDVAIVSNKESASIEVIDRIKFAIERLPLWMQQGIKVWAKKRIEFENGSRIVGAATSKTALSGLTLSILFCDEYDKVLKSQAEEFSNSVFPTVTSSKTGRIIVASTPMGHAQFAELWNKAISGNEYLPMWIRWNEIEGRDEEFKRTTIRNNSLKHWRQEYQCFRGNTEVTLLDKETGKIEKYSLQQLYEMMNPKEKTFCKICNELTSYNSCRFSAHHIIKFHKITIKEYYDKFFKKENEGVCINCGKESTFRTLNRGYSLYCSANCSKTSDFKKKQLSEKWIGRDMKSVNEKRKQTCMEKYGVESYSETDEYKEKRETACLKKYGVKHNFLEKECKQKRINTLENRKDEINEKRKKFWTEENIIRVGKNRMRTCLERYGVDSVSKLETTRHKITETNVKNGRWTSKEFWDDYKKYRRIVDNLSKQVYDKVYENWNGKDYYTGEVLITSEEFAKNNPGVKLNKNELQPTIDHKISAFQGFVDKIPAEKIAELSNLCICSRLTNTRKNRRVESEYKKILKEECGG